MARIRSTRYRTQTVGQPDSSFKTQKTYGSPSTATRRHEYSTEQSYALTIGDYFGVELLKFKRTFDSATGDDIEPTATASNNYQTASVMNGSRIGNFSTTIRLHNTDTGADSFIVDVYAIALSFFDALVWNTVQPTNCPVEMDTTTPLDPPYDLRGQVDFKSSHITFTANNYKNFKFVQHYMKYIGTSPRIYSDADTNGHGVNGTSQWEFTLNGVPPKCRRSNTGMFYGLMFHFDSLKNDFASLSMDASCESTFDEYPATERIPWAY